MRIRGCAFSRRVTTDQLHTEIEQLSEERQVLWQQLSEGLDTSVQTQIKDSTSASRRSGSRCVSRKLACASGSARRSSVALVPKSDSSAQRSLEAGESGRPAHIIGAWPYSAGRRTSPFRSRASRSACAIRIAAEQELGRLRR